MVTLDGKPWFMAADVCRCLGLPFGKGKGSTNRYLYRLDGDEKRVEQVAPGTRSVNIISESGLYKLLMRSDKPEAKPFIDWVTREVLPSIREKALPSQAIDTTQHLVVISNGTHKVATRRRVAFR